jgi:hypothetical protein
VNRHLTYRKPALQDKTSLTKRVTLKKQQYGQQKLFTKSLQKTQKKFHYSEIFSIFAPWKKARNIEKYSFTKNTLMTFTKINAQNSPK